MASLRGQLVDTPVGGRLPARRREPGWVRGFSSKDGPFNQASVHGVNAIQTETDVRTDLPPVLRLYQG